jgi:predicted N-acetyltransferase YhbS
MRELMAETFEVQEHGAAALSEPEIEALGRLAERAFGEKPGRDRTQQLRDQLEATAMSARQQPAVFVIREGEAPIAAARTFGREVQTPSGPLTVMALAGVCSDPAQRGRGLGQTIVRAAWQRVDRGDFSFSLFQTSEALKAFYERLGAVAVDNAFTDSLARDPNIWPWSEPVVMRYPAGPGWPAGTIDLQGPRW